MDCASWTLTIRADCWSCSFKKFVMPNCDVKIQLLFPTSREKDLDTCMNVHPPLLPSSPPPLLPSSPPPLLRVPNVRLCLPRIFDDASGSEREAYQCFRSFGSCQLFCFLQNGSEKLENRAKTRRDETVDYIKRGGGRWKRETSAYNDIALFSLSFFSPPLTPRHRFLTPSFCTIFQFFGCYSHAVQANNQDGRHTTQRNVAAAFTGHDDRMQSLPPLPCS